MYPSLSFTHSTLRGDTMKRFSVVMLTCLLSITTVLSACSSPGGGTQTQTKAPAAPAAPAPTSPNPGGAAAGTAAAKDPSKISGEIVAWMDHPDKVQELVPQFNKIYPNIKVKVENPGEDYHDKIITSLATGTGGPDIGQIRSAHYWRFKALDGLEDLQKAPYNAGRFKQDYTQTSWNLMTSLDNKRLYGIPINVPPVLMFYRADIFEENGFPSDPAELGKLVADPDKFFEMAAALRAKGHYFFRSLLEVTNIASDGSDYYDHDLKYLRNTDVFVNAIDYAKKAQQLDLVFNASAKEMDQGLNTGKFVTRFIAIKSGLDVVKASSPNHIGKWRATSLPFGYVTGGSMSGMSILSQSKNKEAAWAFIEYLTTSPEASTFLIKELGFVSPYKPSRSLPIVKEGKMDVLGGQNVVDFAYSFYDKLKYPIGTPLVKAANDVWNAKIEEAVTKNQDSRTVLKQIMEETEKKVSVDKKKLLDQMGK
jgi:multiple sugar transport system substrate-binding protein